MAWHVAILNKTTDNRTQGSRNSREAIDEVDDRSEDMEVEFEMGVRYRGYSSLSESTCLDARTVSRSCSCTMTRSWHWEKCGEGRRRGRER